MMVDLTVDGVTDVRRRLETACGKWRGDALEGLIVSRLPLIQGRLERNKDGNFVSTALQLRQSLCIAVPAHRKSLTRLLLSAHPGYRGPTLQRETHGTHTKGFPAQPILSKACRERGICSPRLLGARACCIALCFSR